MTPLKMWFKVVNKLKSPQWLIFIARITKDISGITQLSVTHIVKEFR